MFSSHLDTLLAQPTPTMRQFISLLDPKSATELETMAQESHRLTRQHFGKVIRLFAPLYLSNECVNNCTYCGFSSKNPICRYTLAVKDVIAEARYLHNLGVRSILLVAGEHPKFVNDGYLQACLDALHEFIPSLGLEIGPLPDDRYAEIVRHGAEQLVVYQETYDRAVYEQLHTKGPKKDFNWRLDCPERAYLGGFKRIGIGALFGLTPWRQEAIALATHLDYLQKHCWRAQLSVSLPRMRPYAGNYEYSPDMTLSLQDTDFVQTICALRLCFPQVAISVSTRESSTLRDFLLHLGITHLSACAKTEPGGYTGIATATEQFAISDERTPAQVSSAIAAAGLEPVWKDWDFGL